MHQSADHRLIWHLAQGWKQPRAAYKLLNSQSERRRQEEENCCGNQNKGATGQLKNDCFDRSIIFERQTDAHHGRVMKVQLLF